MFQRKALFGFLVLALFFAPARKIFGQQDQGTITGVVQDPSGAVIANAAVTLTNLDQGQVLKAKTDGSGVYVFSPVKIGNYNVTASAPNFQTTRVTFGETGYYNVPSFNERAGDFFELFNPALTGNPAAQMASSVSGKSI